MGSWDAERSRHESNRHLSDSKVCLKIAEVAGDNTAQKTLLYKLGQYLTIILRNRAEYHLILSRRGRRPSWLNQGIFRKIEQDNCFIIQQILIDYHFHNEKNYGSMMKTLKASNTSSLIKIKTELQEIEVYYRSLKKTYLQTHVWK